MSPISLGPATRFEINGIDLTEHVTDVRMEAAVEALPDASLTLSGFWDLSLPSFTLDFTGRWCGLTPAARCFWLKTFYPKFYARLRRMRYETRRRAKRR